MIWENNYISSIIQCWKKLEDDLLNNAMLAYLKQRFLCKQTCHDLHLILTLGCKKLREDWMIYHLNPLKWTCTSQENRLPSHFRVRIEHFQKKWLFIWEGALRPTAGHPAASTGSPASFPTPLLPPSGGSASFRESSSASFSLFLESFFVIPFHSLFFLFFRIFLFLLFSCLFYLYFGVVFNMWNHRRDGKRKKEKG